MIHKYPNPLAGKTVRIRDNVFVHGGEKFEVRDWWDRCSGYIWAMSPTNPVCTSYLIRAAMAGRPEMFNNEVLYGRIGTQMYLIHESEIERRKNIR